jgi:Cu/Ag efflux pump CusA
LHFNDSHFPKGKNTIEKFRSKKIVGKTGSSEVPTDPMPIDASDMMIILKDKGDGHLPKLLMNYQKKWQRTRSRSRCFLRFSISGTNAF